MAEALVADENQEALEAWNGVLFDRFVEFRHLVSGGLAPHGRAGMEILPPREGDRVLDIGCGFGDSSLELAELVGPTGSVLGVDVAPRFIETAQEEAAAAGVTNVRFEVERRSGNTVLRAVRLRVLTVRDDVLRQPGRGASQRSVCARAR